MGHGLGEGYTYGKEVETLIRVDSMGKSWVRESSPVGSVNLMGTGRCREGIVGSSSSDSGGDSDSGVYLQKGITQRGFSKQWLAG